MNRVILIVLDSAGVGALPDAAKYGDEGANTFGHILDSMGEKFSLPNMAKLGLYKILDRKSDIQILGRYGKLATKSPAKDTTAGHWEMMGIVLKKAFPTYLNGFPQDLIEEFEKKIGTKVIGNCAASGTAIINELGDEHVKTGYPIVYTSADSVFQIAVHEEKFGLDKLYKICEIAREMLKGDHAVGRVIARPFLGDNGKYVRTENRKDYSLVPFEDTVLDNLKNAGGEVIAIGKIEDIFCNKGITKAIHTRTNSDGMKVTLEEIKQVNNEIASDKKSLIFTNLVDFDMLWGHRRDVVSYANGLKAFDDFLPTLIDNLNDNDLLIITADHGCDPTYMAHTDHTREYAPLMVYGKKLKGNVDLGIRESLADIGQTISDVLGLKKLQNGKTFNG